MNVSKVGVSTYDQATVLAGKVNWQLEDLSYFRKCGEITTSPDVQCFGLNCRFCSGICLQFEVFIQHLREQHSKDILAMYSTTLNSTSKFEDSTPAFTYINKDNRTVEPDIKLNELIQITPTTDIKENMNTNVIYSKDTNALLTLQLEVVPETNLATPTNEQLISNDLNEIVLAPAAQLEDSSPTYLHLFATPSPSAYTTTESLTLTSRSTSPSSNSFSFVENTLPDNLLSSPDAFEANNLQILDKSLCTMATERPTMNCDTSFILHDQMYLQIKQENNAVNKMEQVIFKTMKLDIKSVVSLMFTILITVLRKI